MNGAMQDEKEKDNMNGSLLNKSQRQEKTESVLQRMISTVCSCSSYKIPDEPEPVEMTVIEPMLTPVSDDENDDNDDDDKSVSVASSYDNVDDDDMVLTDSTPYPMRDLPSPESKRGNALIFNHVFNQHATESRRSGTDVDEAYLYKLFKSMRMDVQVMKDYTVQQIKDKLCEVSLEDHSGHDLLVVAVLTHGLEDTLVAEDDTYSVKELWTQFEDNICPSLAGKPKLFIIQACRGQKRDVGQWLLLRRSGDQPKGQPVQSDPAIHFPTAVHQMTTTGNVAEQLTSPDVHVAYATTLGYVSFRNTATGSVFIQNLCNTMQYSLEPMDYQRVMTTVSRNIALKFKANPSYFTKLDQSSLKQMPNSQSTLVRPLYIPMEKKVSVLEYHFQSSGLF